MDCTMKRCENHKQAYEKAHLYVTSDISVLFD